MLNLIGQEFGFVKVIERTDRRKRHSVVWKCLCDCGNTCYFSAKELKEVKSKSCGCKNPWAKDLTGQIFGRVEVLEMTDERQLHGQGAHVVWKCKCHGCGNEVKLSSRTLLINGATSCGCRGLKPGDAAFNCLLTSYKKWARNKNVKWNLTKEQAKTLFKNDCHYCGEKPKNISKSKSYIKDGKRIHKEEYTYNGLDEVNPGAGYTIDNAVSCCKKCNEVKLAMTLQEFEEYISRVYNHYYIDNGRQKTYNLSEIKHDIPRTWGSGQAPFNQTYSDYRTHARYKGVCWKLTKAQAKELFESNCHYCGAKPSNLCDPKQCIGSFIYSGIDAVDNTQGYLVDNVVPCCTKCNKSKRAMTLKEWESYIYRLYNCYFIEKKRAGD